MLTAIVSFLRDTLYAKKFEEDIREVSFEFQVKWLGRFGFVGADPIYALQLFSLVCLQSVGNIFVSLVIYECILAKPMKGSWTSYIVGYGVIFPVMVLLPFWWIDSLDLRNQAMMFVPAVNSCLVFFRCMEAMHDTVPAFAQTSRVNFALYTAAAIQFRYDHQSNQTVACSFSGVILKAARYGWLALQTAFMFSLLYPRNYELIPLPKDGLVLSCAIHLVNNLAMASLTSLCLDAGATAFGMGMALITGIDTVPLHDNPLIKSQSPSEFWNRRWNTLVSNCLKRAVYMPLKQSKFSKSFAALATFVASGIMHEYIILVLCYWKIVRTGQLSLSGTHLIFFAYNGVVVIFESCTKDLEVIHYVARKFPKPIKTALVILIVLPLAQFFTQIYVDIGFYTAIGLGLPRVEYLGSAGNK